MTKCALVLLVAGFLISTGARAQAGLPIKVMSFNLRYDAGAGEATDRENAWISKSGEHRRDLAMYTIADYDPDLLCVQEALTNQAEDIRAKFPEYAFYGVGRDDGKQEGEYSGIFYRKERFDCRKQGEFWLNEKSDQAGSRFPETCCARIATWVVLRDRHDGNEFVLLNTHWDHQVQAARVFSAKLIRKRLAELAEGKPVIVTGDLNAQPDNLAFQMLIEPSNASDVQLIDSYRKAHSQVADEEATYHGFRGSVRGARIDYVLHSSEFRTKVAGIERWHLGQRYPSDHYPVTATLEFNGE